eukprot:6640366-Alexandrium_andersonii.AAC.1
MVSFSVTWGPLTLMSPRRTWLASIFAQQPPAADGQEAAGAEWPARYPGARIVWQLSDGRQRKRLRLLGRPKASDSCPVRFALGERQIVGPRMAGIDVDLLVH